MNEIGEEFKAARTASSLELKEVSKDTEIPFEALEQIESGAIGSFKDLLVLKEYLQTYAKYLGIDTEWVIDKFNEYMFEYTSKLPTIELEKKIAEKELEEKELLEQTREIKAVTPYLKPKEEKEKTKIIMTVVVIIILTALTLVWAIKQVS